MVWLRSWTIVLVLLAFSGGSLFLLSPVLLGERSEAMLLDRLEQAGRAAPLWLQTEARHDLDGLEHAATDAVLIESLASVSRSAADSGLVRKTVLDRLRTFQPKFKAEILAALDGQGKVVARAGQEEEFFGDSLVGFPVVSDALRGIYSDDVWSLAGKLYRVSAVTVIGHDKYLGALLLMREVNPLFAKEMAQTIGMDVAFVMQERVVCASESSEILAKLPALWAKTKQPNALPARTIETVKTRYWTRASTWVGEAAEQGASYILFAAAPKTLSPAEVWGILKTTSFKKLPWAPLRNLTILSIVSLIIAFALFHWEIGGPLRRINVEVRNVSRGSQPRLDAERYPLGFAPLARGINLLIDRGAPEEEPPPAPEPLPPPPKAAKEPTPKPAAPTSLADFAAILSVPDSAPLPTEPAPESRPAPINLGDLQARPTRLSESDADLKVFQEYIETRRQLGEPTQGLTFEKVFDRLRAHRADLLKKYACSRVDFQVYVKDGKAAIKARPVFE